MKDEDTVAKNSVASQLAGGSSGTEYGAWVSFYNYNNRKCNGTQRWNNHCAWLYHKTQQYSNDVPQGPLVISAYPASSGNNLPSDKWVRDVGPVPNKYKKKRDNGTFVEKTDYNWGRMYDDFTGYETDERESFYPGKWRLDEWEIYKPENTTKKRTSFEIHGGRNSDGSSKLWSTMTQGCIRLTINGINGLKSKWDNKTDNRRTAKVYVKHK